MKAYKNRILFGEEKQLLQVGEERCSVCGCSVRSFHAAGCSAEECPECGKALVGCCCEVLSPYDAEKIIQGLFSQFEDLEAALEAAGDERCPGAAGSSYLQHAVMKYIFNNVPESARREIARAFHSRFPNLTPHIQDEDGRGYFTAEQLADALDIPLQEVNERIDAMVASGQVIQTPDGKLLRKVH